MKQQAEKGFPRMVAIFAALLMALIILVPMAMAMESDKGSATIKLSGRDSNGKYELSTKDLYLFSLEDVSPGDTWSGSVDVVNDTDDDMSVSVYSITSNLKDTVLYDELDLEISVAGEEAYAGAYSVKHCPVTSAYLIGSGESMSFDINVSLPETAGNKLQNSQMDSTWTFDASFYGPGPGAGDGGDNGDSTVPADPESPAAPTEPVNPMDPPNSSDPGNSTTPDGSKPGQDIVKTGVDLMRSNTAIVSALIILLLSIVAVGILQIQIHRAQKQEEQEHPASSEKED